MRKNNKKGFTIIELVIVIAVIAILAGVLIPTFSSVIQKARVSSDQQAIRQMNTALAAEGVTDENMDIYDMFAVLEDTGLSAKDYKALSTGKSFFWDAEINRVLYVDETGAAIYPAEYDGRTNNGKWYSLTQTIEVKQPEASKYVDNKVTVSSGAELAYVMKNDLKKQGSTITTIELANDIDMMGAAFDIGDDQGKLNKDLAIVGSANAPVVIKNATAVKSRKTYAKASPGSDGIYNMGLVGEVALGKKLTIENITFENLNCKDTNTGNCAFLVGTLYGELVVKDVVIKNSSLIGYNSVSALVAYPVGSAKMSFENVLVTNVELQTVGGRVGKIFGNAANVAVKNVIGADNAITLTNVTTGIYACDQNTGTCKLCSESLGLKGSLIDSWEVNGKGEYDHNHNKSSRVYYADSLIGYIGNGKIEAEVKASAIYARLEALVA